MAIKTTEAIVLKAYNWSESSRTVIFFTRGYGKLPLTDKGGRSMTSKRGRLVPFARLEITFYHSEKETAGYLSDVALIKSYEFERDGTLGRLAFASAGCELLMNLLGEREPQEDLFEYYVSFLDLVETVPKQGLGPMFVTFFIRLLSMLGYHPSLGYCVACGASGDKLTGPEGEAYFSAERGGMVCGACKSVGDYYIRFSGAGYRVLLALQSASLAQAAEVPISYRETVQLIEALTKFTAYQADIRSELKSVMFLEKLKGGQGADSGE